MKWLGAAETSSDSEEIPIKNMARHQRLHHRVCEWEARACHQQEGDYQIYIPGLVADTPPEVSVMAVENFAPLWRDPVAHPNKISTTKLGGL